MESLRTSNGPWHMAEGGLRHSLLLFKHAYPDSHARKFTTQLLVGPGLICGVWASTLLRKTQRLLHFVAVQHDVKIRVTRDSNDATAIPLYLDTPTGSHPLW